jgi:hypothetical protein
MSTSGDPRNPVEVLAEEFLKRKRRGEKPTLREYLDRHPDLGDEIRELFPALLMMEDLGDSSARSDVYSLGLTLYELVALRPAFEASDRHALIERVLHEEPERLKKLAPSVPRDLETIIA